MEITNALKQILAASLIWWRKKWLTLKIAKSYVWTKLTSSYHMKRYSLAAKWHSSRNSSPKTEMKFHPSFTGLNCNSVQFQVQKLGRIFIRPLLHQKLFVVFSRSDVTKRSPCIVPSVMLRLKKSWNMVLR